MRACCGVGTVNICTESDNSVKVEVLVVHNKTQDFDLLPEIDAITTLGGDYITHWSRTVLQQRNANICSDP